MKTSKWLLGALLGLLMTFAAGTGHALDADSDSLTVRITPNADFGVDIDTGTLESGGVIDLGTVDLYESVQTVQPATVTITGNVASAGANTGQELTLTSVINGGWAFDQTPSTYAVLGAVDELAMYALFSDTSLSVPPSGDDFAGDDADYDQPAGTTVRVGGANPTNGAKFEKTGTGATDMDNLSPADERHLWLFFRLPNNTSTGDAQDVTVTLTAVSAGS